MTDQQTERRLVSLHCRDCAGSHVSSTGDYSECPGLPQPATEPAHTEAGLAAAIEALVPGGPGITFATEPALGEADVLAAVGVDGILVNPLTARSKVIAALRLAAQPSTEVERLTEALERIAYHGHQSGVIACPQDHGFYIEPMQEIARAALAEPVRDRPMTALDERHIPLRVWSVGMPGVDHLSRGCPHLRTAVAYRRSRAEPGGRARPICRWCLNHPEHWDD